MKITETIVNMENMRFRAHHGVLPQEQDTGGIFLVSLRIAYPFLASLDSDDIKDTLNYAEVYDIVRDEMKETSKLIEHVAGRISRHLLSSFPKITSLDIELKKINPPMGADCDSVSVQLHFEN